MHILKYSANFLEEQAGNLSSASIVFLVQKEENERGH